MIIALAKIIAKCRLFVQNGIEVNFIHIMRLLHPRKCLLLLSSNWRLKLLLLMACVLVLVLVWQQRTVSSLRLQLEAREVEARTAARAVAGVSREMKEQLRSQNNTKGSWQTGILR